MLGKILPSRKFERTMFIIASVGVAMFAGYFLCAISYCPVPPALFAGFFWPTLIAFPALLFGSMYSTTNESAYRAYTLHASIYVWISIILVFIVSLDSSSSGWAAPSISAAQVEIALGVVFVLSSTIGYIFRMSQGKLKPDYKE